MRYVERTPARLGLATAVLSVALVALLPAASRPAAAAEHPLALKSGAGRELVESRCAACHSLDYVVMNSPFLSAEQWQASVAKMRSFGAPLSDDEARTIVAYLAGAYGRP